MSVVPLRSRGGWTTRGYLVWCERGLHIVNVYIEANAPLSPALAIAQAEHQLGDNWRATSFKRLRGRVSRPEGVPK